jgi:hypothetical protein
MCAHRSNVLSLTLDSTISAFHLLNLSATTYSPIHVVNWSIMPPMARCVCTHPSKPHIWCVRARLSTSMLLTDLAGFGECHVRNAIRVVSFNAIQRRTRRVGVFASAVADLFDYDTPRAAVYRRDTLHRRFDGRHGVVRERQCKRLALEHYTWWR